MSMKRGSTWRSDTDTAHKIPICDSDWVRLLLTETHQESQICSVKKISQIPGVEQKALFQNKPINLHWKTRGDFFRVWLDSLISKHFFRGFEHQQRCWLLQFLHFPQLKQRMGSVKRAVEGVSVYLYRTSCCTGFMLQMNWGSLELLDSSHGFYQYMSGKTLTNHQVRSDWLSPM